MDLASSSNTDTTTASATTTGKLCTIFVNGTLNICILHKQEN